MNISTTSVLTLIAALLSIFELSSSVGAPEVFAFTDGRGSQYYDWERLTTLCYVNQDVPSDLIDLAHSHDVKVVALVDFDTTVLLDRSKQSKWIKAVISNAKQKNLDGINIDFESMVAKDSEQVAALTKFVKKISKRMHAEIPGSQVTFDIAHSPDGIDGRFYDAVGIAKVVDFLFVMAYDMRSQIYTQECLAGPNSPAPEVLANQQRFLQLGIPGEKLVLGLPWYGYRYECLSSPSTSERACPIHRIPFRGAPCSDASGSQHVFADIMDTLNQTGLSRRQWDQEHSVPYFSFEDSYRNLHQFWYDDEESLAIKYCIAGKLGFKGVGFWRVDFLNWQDDASAARSRQDMFAAIDAFNDESKCATVFGGVQVEVSLN